MAETTAPLYALFDALADGVCLADAGGDVLYMNPAAVKLLGLKDWRRELRNACELLCGKLELAGGGRAADACELRQPSPAQAVSHCGRHGPHSAYNWAGDRIQRSNVWKDLRVRCLRAATRKCKTQKPDSASGAWAIP